MSSTVGHAGDTLALARQAGPRARAGGPASAPRLVRGGVRLALGMILPLALLGLWQWAVERVWLPPQLLPAPALVWESLRELLRSGELFDHLQVSLARVAWSVLLGGVLGLTLGVAMALSLTVRAYLRPSVEALSQFPVIGWAPLLIIFVGIDEALKITALTIAVIVPFTVSAYKGLLNVPAAWLDVGRVYGFSHWQTLRRVAFPAALPSLIGGVRQGVMQAWLALVFVELLVSSEGVGYLMVYARNLMQLDVVVVCMLAVGAVGVVFDILLSRLERRLHHWHVGAY